ncbi:MAG: TAXI family TRAP transporter solute-binding subunit [Alphaproteobacteria bacterium]
MSRSAIGKLHGAGALAVALALFAAATPAAAQQKWALGTSSTGSGPYVNGVIIANHVNAAQDVIEISAQTTGGYNENVALVAAGRIDVGMTNSVDLENAYFSRDKYADLKGNEVFKNVRALFSFYGGVYHYLTLADSGIETFDDIRGRKINLNTPSTFTRGFNEDTLKAAGIGLDEIEVFSISTGKHFDALKDGVIDAGFHGYALGLAGLQQLTATKKIRLLDLPDEAFDRLNAMYHNGLTKFVIPANTYAGQTEPVKTTISMTALFVNKDADEDAVYAFAKAYWQTVDDMGKESQSFKGFTPALGRYVGETPVHPGVLRFYKEIGLE